MYVFTIFPWLNVLLSWSEQLPLSFTLDLVPKDSGARLLSDVVGSLIISSDNPLNFHSEIQSVLPIFLKYLHTDWNTK